MVPAYQERGRLAPYTHGGYIAGMPTTDETSRTLGRGREWITTGLAALLVGGVFVDGWAHVNRPGMETFFTPWHGLMYSALALLVGWLLRVAWKGGVREGRWKDLPSGYLGALLGAGLFMLGGVADLAWHEVFGIESGVDALVSPTHLLLGAGGLLLVSTVTRGEAGTREQAAWSWPGRVSLSLTVALAVFFLLYASPFTSPPIAQVFEAVPEGAPGHEAAELPVVAGLASYLVAAAVVSIPVQLMTSPIGHVVRGGPTLVVVTVALLPAAVAGLPPVALGGALGAVAGALTFEVVWARLAPSVRATVGQWSTPGLVALVGVGHLLGVALLDEVRWPPSMVGGMLALTTAASAAVALLAVRGTTNAEAPSGASA